MSILMAFELTLDYTIAPLLMVNCVVAYYCSSIFEKQFIYGESLERKGAAFFNRQLAEAKIADLIRRDPVTLPRTATFAELEKSFLQHQYRHVYIVGDEMEFLGAVSVHDLKKYFDQPEVASSVTAADIMNKSFPRISPAQRMADALEKFSEVTCERLPVVDSLSSSRLIGTISKTDIMLHLAGKTRSSEP
jgi:chloride channel protein, CIC family